MPITYCLFSAQYRPTVGGVENHTHYLAEEIVKNGGQAIIVTSALKGLPEHEVLPSGVEVFRLPSLSLGGGRLPVVLHTAKTRRLLKMLDVRPINRIVIQTRLYALCLLGANYARRRGLPAIVIEHGAQYTAAGNPLADGVLALYVRLLFNEVRRRCSSFYGVSQSACNWLAAQGVKPKGVIHNAVSLVAVHRALAKGKIDYRARYHVPPNSLLLAFAGRVISQKGILELVQAVQAFNAQNPSGVFLLVAGEGELVKVLERQAPAHVALLGRLDFDAVVALCAQVDIFCLPTALDEGFPSSLLEAGACGAFVMATDRGGVREIVPDEDHGLLLADNAPKTLCAGIERAATAPEWRKKAAAALQRRVEENFSYKAVYESLEAMEWEGRK